jgi:hypothetical protein
MNRLHAIPAAPLALAFLLALAGGAGAAPLPSPRTPPPRPVGPLSLAPAETDVARPGFCGTRLEAVTELLQENLARPEAEPLPTPHSADVGDIAVLEDDATFFFTTKNGDPVLDLAQAARAFYRTHGDDYDCLAVYLASGLGTWLGSPTALAGAYPVRNQIQGIGLDPFDIGAGFGSAARLELLLSMNGLGRYPADPDANIGGDTFSTMDVLLHEFGHRWLAYTLADSAGTASRALLGRDLSHWNFFLDADSSLMEGCDWARPAPDSFRTDGVSSMFSPLDQYLMGLRPPSETGSVFTVNDPTAFDPPGIYVNYTSPFVGLGCRGRAYLWGPADIEAVYGPRLPDAEHAPHSFRVAFALVVARDSSARPTDLAQLDTIRTRSARYFERATEGRGTLDCTLLSRAGQVVIRHEPLRDTEDALSARPVGARVGIAQAGIPIALDPGSVGAHWRGGTTGAFTAIPMSPAAGDSFAALLPALPGGGTAQYYLYAASDSAGIEAFDPPAGPAAPHAYTVGPDLTPPVVAHHAVATQGRDRLPQSLLARVTDNLGVDSVWVEFTADSGPLTKVAASRAGRDSFAVSLGGSLGAGGRLAYRFVARDRAAAHNLAYSNSVPDTLVAGCDWLLDFENGGDGLTHGHYWYSYRDAWHLSQQQSSPPGGSAWKCGAEDTLLYPPHLDAVLYLPVIARVDPGVRLVFEHRYGLEQANGVYAWDGARIEGQIGSGAWQVLAPAAGYTHRFYLNSNPFQRDTPCWSGSSGGWRSETVDLTPLAPGPARVRFRMLADDFMGGEGWFVDHVRVEFPETTLSVPAISRVALGSPWPNPARAALRQSLSLTRPSVVEWSLYDLAGRRVATLWKGAAPAGGFELSGALPAALPSGLYFARLVLDGRVARSDRIAILR